MEETTDEDGNEPVQLIYSTASIVRPCICCFLGAEESGARKRKTRNSHSAVSTRRFPEIPGLECFGVVTRWNAKRGIHSAVSIRGDSLKFHCHFVQLGISFVNWLAWDLNRAESISRLSWVLVGS
jgi:hypothetical protein